VKLRVLNIFISLVLLFLFSGTAFADCAVLTPEEEQYNYLRGLTNQLVKVIILVPTIILTLTVAWRLARTKLGYMPLVLMGIGSVPILLFIPFLELWSMECGIGGIPAPYYLIVLFAVLAVFLANRYARNHPA
jgi:hypothetical protein